MPFSAAHATKRPTMSPQTGCEPTRNRPRSAIPSGVETRALIARIRSHGVSAAAADGRVEDAAAGDLEAREPGLVEDLGDAQDLRGRQAPASGSCESSRTVVSTSFGTAGDLSDLLERASTAGSSWARVRRARCSDPRAGRP